MPEVLQPPFLISASKISAPWCCGSGPDNSVGILGCGLRDLCRGRHLSEPQFLHLEDGAIVVATLSVGSGEDSR